MEAPRGPATGRRQPAMRAILAGLAVLTFGAPALAQEQPSPAASIHFGDIEPVSMSIVLPPPPPPVPETPPAANRQPAAPMSTIPVVENSATSPNSQPPPRAWDKFGMDDGITQTSCPSCGGAPPAASLPPAAAGPGAPGQGGRFCDSLFWGCTNCGVDSCYPGRKECYPCCNTDSACERFFCNLYHCICCPDPCYEGKWLPIADAAFFVECARPVSQTRLRWDSGVDLILPDRSEFFWARADGKGRGPNPPAPALAETRLNYNELSLYTEIATGAFSFIIEMPYRSIDPEIDPHAANFGDMNIATKTMIFDCELLQVALMMRTYLPTGSPGKGLGTGHVSLEPSLIVGIKLNEDAYLQGQVAEWIPLGGDPDYAGAILHYHFSFNQVLCRILPNVPLIGTMEFSGYSFQDGAYTDPLLGPFQRSSGDSYLYLGAGLRLFVCDRIDFGVGFEMSLTDQHFADQIYRSEFRFRY